MRINSANGSIIFVGGTLDAHIRRRQFLSSTLGSDAKTVVDNKPWITYELHLEPDVIASVVFHAERLVEVRLFMVDLEEEEHELSGKDKEVARNERHEKWLASQLGPPPNSYQWGTAEATLDPRSVSSQIIVRYYENE